MTKSTRRYSLIAAGWLLLFVLFTIAVSTIDVQSIGPEGSRVGLAAVNRALFERLGARTLWLNITEALGIVAILVAAGFALLGLYQAVRRKGILRVDGDLLALAAFYVAVALAYVFFEVVVINYRPILVGGALEASYPSSHTMLVVCIMSAAIMQFHRRIGSRPLRVGAEVISAAIIAVTVVGRLLSGMHWFTDIVGGLLLSVALVTLYGAALARQS